MSAAAIETTGSELTPELLDLFEHEKVIEQGLASFIDVGMALARIKADRKYRHAGFTTFEQYLADRWDMSRAYGHRLVVAASIAGSLMSPRGDIPTPETEKQVRPLAGVPEVDRPAAWADAVESAGGDQPTAAQVEEAAKAYKLPKSRADHPAPFSDPILEQVARRVEGAGRVLDPFAGTGRVHELVDRANVGETVGVEIEPEWAAKHPGTVEGNALHLTDQFDAESFDAIATSPTYGNRMADHHDATDDSFRPTYKHTLGHDLHDDNSGAMQWGDDYRAFHQRAWAQSCAVLKPGGTFVVNIKDHVRGGVKQDVVAWHIDVLCRQLGLECVGHDIIPTRGLPAGQNAQARVAGEVVLTFRKAA